MPAAAAPPPENPVQGVAAIDQYVEAIPTSSGPAPTGGDQGAARPLPQQAAREVRAEGGSDAETLIELATSPTYGAPQARADTNPGRVESGDVREPIDTQPSPLDAVVTPLAEADEPRLLFLLALLGGMTLLALALAAQRQRTSER